MSTQYSHINETHKYTMLGISVFNNALLYISDVSHTIGLSKTMELYFDI